MNALKFRQVHLDFHTSGVIPEIGVSFDKKQFQGALILGHVNSITVFSKCHHGYAYHPTKVHEIHPNLSFDLLGEQLKACKEIGVNAPVYISAGFDEKEAVRHPEWIAMGSPNSSSDFVNGAGYHLLCYNTGYLDLLLAQIEEVMQNYNPSGIFLDISNVRVCYCSKCRQALLDRGKDPRNFADVYELGEEVYANYCKKVEQVVRKYSTEATIFHNAGNIVRGRRDLANYDTHLELESLPTGGWGYDHFPMSAAYTRTLGKEFLGMTGKFHTTWGEFGGFKHPNALKYEAALSIASGAKCSIGDQLHPSGEMNMSTYNLIGQAFADVEAKEKWCDDVTPIVDIAVLSNQAFNNANDLSDIGACRILLESKYLFNLVDKEENLDNYKLLILPDHIRITEELQKRLNLYIANGGKILASGEAGLWNDKDEFALDLGVKYEGVNQYCPSYMVPNFEMINGTTDYVMYERAFNIKAEKGNCIVNLEEPYFNRDALHYSSHQHTPNKPNTARDGGVLTDKTAYICWNVFDDYSKKGSFHLKELVTHLIEELIGKEKTLTATLPDRGIVTLMEQKSEQRLVNHLLFAHTTVRGRGIEVIEDIVPIYDVKVTIKLNKAPQKVYLAPQMKSVAYTYSKGLLSYNVDKVDIHQMVVIDL